MKKNYLRIIFILTILFLVFLIIDYLDIKKFNMENIKVSNKKFNEKDWKKYIKRDMMIKDLLKNYEFIIENNKERKRILGYEEDLKIGNIVSILEEYEYKTQGYKIFDKGRLLKKKVFLVFYRKKCVIVEEEYIFDIMMPNSILDCESLVD
jgi:hypothetical protein